MCARWQIGNVKLSLLGALHVIRQQKALLMKLFSDVKFYEHISGLIDKKRFNKLMRLTVSFGTFLGFWIESALKFAAVDLSFERHRSSKLWFAARSFAKLR